MQAPAIVTAIASATGAGAVGAKLLDRWLGRRDRRHVDDVEVEKAEISDGAKMREELWAEIRDLRSRMDTLDRLLADSRVSYAQLLGEHFQLKAEHQSLREEHQELQRKHESLTGELQALRELQSG